MILISLIIAHCLQNLWREKNALQEIVFDLLESLKAETIARTTKSPSSKFFREALNFSKLQLISQLEHEQSSYAYEIYSLTQIDSEYIAENVESIQEAIEIENNNMEQFVDDLRRAISDESYLESLLRNHALAASESASFSSSIDDKNTSSNNRPNPSKSSSRPLPVSSSSSKARSGSIVRAALQAKREGNASLQPIVMLKSSSARFASSAIEEEDSPTIKVAQSSRSSNNQSNSTSPDAKAITPRGGSGSGRFRNRLKDAQAELYFADD